MQSKVIVSELSDEESREALRELDAQLNAQPVQPDVDYEKAREAYRQLRLAQVDSQLAEVMERIIELTGRVAVLRDRAMALNTRVRTAMQELS